jgi:hypothetical protein
MSSDISVYDLSSPGRLSKDFAACCIEEWVMETK